MAFKALVTLLLLFLMSKTNANAQINVPAEVELGHKIHATIETVPPNGGKLSVLWNADARLDTISQNTDLFIWGRPGVYKIDCVTIPLREVTLNGDTFFVIVGDIERHFASFKITGKVEPEPDPEPDPDPTDAPFPAPGYTVLIIREAKEVGPLPEEQKAIFTDSSIRKLLRDKCVKLEDNRSAIRFWDDDLTDDQLGNVPEVLRNGYREVLKQSAGQLPWIAISTGKTGVSQPLPATIEETLELLKKF